MVAVEGEGEAQISGGGTVALRPGLRLPPGSRIVTGPGGAGRTGPRQWRQPARGGRTSVSLGHGARGSSGHGREGLNISGVAVIDRRGIPGAVTVDVASFEVLLADARVFIDGVQDGSVLVKDGMAEVVLADTRLALLEGQGVDLPGETGPAAGSKPGTGAPPIPESPGPPPPGMDGTLLVRVWGKGRIEAAFASVDLTV